MENLLENIDKIIRTASIHRLENYGELASLAKGVRYQKPLVYKKYKNLEKFINSSLLNEDNEIVAIALAASIADELVK